MNIVLDHIKIIESKNIEVIIKFKMKFIRDFDKVDIEFMIFTHS